MPVPKRKRSHARKHKRYANKGWKVQAITECKNCQAPLATHVACKGCGFYKGRKVLETKVDRALKRGTAQQKKVARQAQAQPAITEPASETP